MIRKLFALLVFLALPGVAQADWYEASSEHFLVYSNDKPDRLQQFATTLERFDQAFRLFHGMPNDPPGLANRVTIYLVSSTEAVGRLAGNEMAAGFYSGHASGSVAFVPRASAYGDGTALNGQQILFHEYTHHLMFSMFVDAAFPPWFVEGWAEFHATAQVRPDGSVVFGYGPRYRAESLFSDDQLSLRRMLLNDTAHLTGDEVISLYGRGWLLTHFLNFQPGRERQLPQYLRAIGEGKSLEEASQVFGDLKTLDRELQAYLNKPLAGHSIPASAIKLEPVTVRPLTAGEAATMAVRIRSEAGVDEHSAPYVFADAQRAAAPFPGDVGAQLELASAALDANQYAAALAACGRARAVNPKSIRALTYEAMARIEIAKAAKDKRPETWNAIRQLVAAANRLDPDDPEPLILYFRTYDESGSAIPAIALQGMYRAYELAPFDDDLRMSVARAYLIDKNPAMARTVLRPLAFDPHNGKLAARAAKVVGEIEKGDIPGAMRDLAGDAAAKPSK